MSFMPDQLWYGRRTEAIGAGVVLPWRRRRLLGRTLDRILASTAMRENARRVAEAVRAKDGVATTCDALERLLADPSRRLRVH
jgi:UDP:flavonoid glycosyltransferase YjiC (YdhE family)